jgi:HEAT repeat protein
MNQFAESDKDRARGICLSQLKSPRNEALRVLAIRILGRVKDQPGQTEAYDALVKVTKEKSFGARAAAIDALAEYGDKKAIPVLEPLLNHPLSFLRNNVQGAVARLKGR